MKSRSVVLPADEEEMSVEVSALGGLDEAFDCHSFAETDDDARSLRSVQVIDHLRTVTISVTH